MKTIDNYKKQKYEEEKNMENKRGITLIALIITIIILLLLAGVALNTIMGKNGIINNAESSIGAYNNSVNKEKEDINKLGEYLNNYVNSTGSIKEQFEKDPNKYKNPSQSPTNNDIAISEDGESVNLDLWKYVLRGGENEPSLSEYNEMYYELADPVATSGGKCTGGPSYSSDRVIEGKIEGKIPAYIYNASTGKVIEVASMYGTFAGLVNLTECPDIPSTVKYLEGTFSSTGITSAVIPDSVTTIGSFAFYRCSGLTSISIPDSVTAIGYEAFYECRGLTSISIPDSVTTIGDHAFSGCAGLTSISIPDSVSTIEQWAFSECTSIGELCIPSSVERLR